MALHTTHGKAVPGANQILAHKAANACNSCGLWS